MIMARKGGEGEKGRGGREGEGDGRGEDKKGKRERGIHGVFDLIGLLHGLGSSLALF